MKHNVAPDIPPATTWYKSSYSSGETGTCVEVASLDEAIGVRDSKDLSQTPFTVEKATWNTFANWVTG